MAPVYPSRLRKAEVEYEILARGGAIPPTSDKLTLDALLHELLIEDHGLLPLAAEDCDTEKEFVWITAFIESMISAREEDGLVNFSRNARYAARMEHWLRRLDRVLDTVIEKDSFKALRGRLKSLMESSVENGTVTGNFLTEPVENVSSHSDSTVISTIEVPSPFKDLFSGSPKFSVSTTEQVYHLLVAMVSIHRIARGFLVPDNDLIKILYPHTEGQLTRFLLQHMSLSPSWTSLRKSILTTFLSQVDRLKLITGKYYRSQYRNETFCNYCDEIITVAQALMLDDSESDIVLTIGRGALLPEIRSHFIFEPFPATFEALQSISAAIVALRNNDSGSFNIPSRPQMNNPISIRSPTISNIRDNSLRPRPYSVVSQTPGLPNGNNLVCWKCNTSGHIRRDCPQQRHVQRFSTFPGRNPS